MHDFGAAADDYARHRQGFPEETFARLAELGVGLEGQRLLDLGTGTGTLARGFARRGARVTGLDRAPELLAQARRLAEEAGVDARWVRAGAEETGLPDASFDAATAGQCWHWFDAERALAELRRVLAPGGLLALASWDWLPRPGSVPEATEALILAHNPAWTMGGGDGLHPEWRAAFELGGFALVGEGHLDLDARYSHADWRGRIRASAGVRAGGLSPEETETFDRAHAALLAERFPEEPLPVPHRLAWAVGVRSEQGSS